MKSLKRDIVLYRKKPLKRKDSFQMREVAEYNIAGIWHNVLIKGENLSVLKHLQEDESIGGKVRLIYIDPPFAKNRVFKSNQDRTSTISCSSDDNYAYSDILLGDDYLEYLRKRLYLLKNLLSDDGSIYVHIDWKIGHYLKILMDEIFGTDNFINDITRIKCNPKNFNRKAYGNIKDMILFYSKSKNYVWNDSREDMTEEEIVRLFPRIDKQGRRYATTPLHAPGETINGATGRPWRGIRPPKGRHWRYHPDELEIIDKNGLIEWSSTGNPRKKIYADYVLARGKKRQDIWEFKDPVYPSYPTEKNIDMLKMIIESSSNPDDIVLDCFAGSGTTLVAAELAGRKWIGIDNSGVAVNTIKRRLEKMSGLSRYLIVDDLPLIK
jgi:adenine-specific DNA-methyltransferase